VLSDDEKRKVYDQFGEEGIKGGAGAGGPGGTHTMNVDPREIFKQFFGGGDAFGGASSGGGGGPGSFFQFQTGPGGESSPFGGSGASATAPPPGKLHTIRLKTVSGEGLGIKLSKANEVIELTRGGAAETAGLRVGDVVYEVDGTSLNGSARAAELLKTARSMHMLKVAFVKGVEGQAIEVRVPRPTSGSPLGIKVDSDNVVRKVVEGPAAAHGRLRVGDRVLTVNGKSLRGGAKLVDVVSGLPKSVETLSFRVLPEIVQLTHARQRASMGSGGGSAAGGFGGRRSAAGGFGGFGGGVPGMGGSAGGGGMGIDPEMLRNMMGGIGGMGGSGMGGGRARPGGSGGRSGGMGGGMPDLSSFFGMGG